MAQQRPFSRLPKLSIGLSIYNAEEFLAYALDYFLAQTFRTFEIIIGDNASPDKILQICREYVSNNAFAVSGTLTRSLTSTGRSTVGCAIHQNGRLAIASAGASISLAICSCSPGSRPTLGRTRTAFIGGDPRYGL
jgi:GT2 family glycosyltransferase